MDDDLPTQALPEHLPLRCVLMRGGTSKGVFLRAADLPSDPRQRDRVILALFGSPDPRQIDGLGGADILTSKVAIIGPPSRPDADVDYTFGQVSITEPVVDYDMNCGNISAAVGVYAIEEGLVRPTDPRARPQHQHPDGLHGERPNAPRDAAGGGRVPDRRRPGHGGRDPAGLRWDRGRRHGGPPPHRTGPR